MTAGLRSAMWMGGELAELGAMWTGYGRVIVLGFVMLILSD